MINLLNELIFDGSHATTHLHSLIGHDFNISILEGFTENCSTQLYLYKLKMKYIAVDHK